MVEVLDQSYEITDIDYNFGTTAANYYWGQGVTASKAGPVTKVSIYLKATNDTVSVTIYSDSGGEPDSSVSDTTVRSSLDGYAWYDFTITNCTSFNINDKYHIVGYCTTSSEWYADSSAGYAGGTAHMSADTITWHSSGDLNFRSYVDEVISPLVAIRKYYYFH